VGAKEIRAMTAAVKLREDFSADELRVNCPWPEKGT
jgi:hypothetical protein